MLLPISEELLNRRLAKAGSSLVIRLPFFGYLLFGTGVKVRLHTSISTMATDGVNIYVGEKFLRTEDLDLVMFGLLHELVHVYFSHASRRGDRDKKLWNIAADIFTNEQCSIMLGTEINNTLVPWTVPKRFIQPQMWASGKTIEEIYELLKQQQAQDPNTTKNLTPSEEEEIGSGDDIIPVPEGVDPQDDKEWQNIFREDVAHAKGLSDQTTLQGPLPPGVRSRMDKIMRPTLPWGSLVRGTLCEDLGWDEETYCPPKMKYYPIILPQTRQTKERILALLVDISASVTDELIRIFISNVQAAALRATETLIITFDQIVREQYRTKNPRDIFSKVKFESGAHSYTSAVDAFNIAVAARASAVCCLTDGYIDLPPKKVKNTTFVLPEGGRTQPWGKHYIMEHPWR